jgi:hypothetical protein
MTRFFHAPDDPGAGGAAPATDSTPPASTPPAEAEPQWTGMASQFPREIREKHKDLLLGEYKDKKASDVFEELVEAKGKLGRAIVIPDPKTATADDMAAFRKTMGIPDSGDGYELNTEPYKGIKGIDDLAKDFRTRALANGLTKTQAAKEFEYLANIAKFGADQQAKAMADHKASFAARLLDACGKDAKVAEEVTNRYKAFLAKQIGDPEILKDLDASGIMYSAKFAAKVAEISKAFDDAPWVDGKPPATKPAHGEMGSYSPAFEAMYGGKK